MKLINQIYEISQKYFVLCSLGIELPFLISPKV